MSEKELNEEVNEQTDIDTEKTEEVPETDAMNETNPTEGATEEVLQPEEEDNYAVLQAENEQQADQILRLQAEIANIQRTNARNQQNITKYRSQQLATSLLDVIDNLERALETEVTTEDATALKKGVEMVLNQFKAAFESEKITAIDPLNEPFDPNFHQAVSMMPAGDGQESNTVIQVLQKGYVLEDRVIRPAMVIVAE